MGIKVLSLYDGMSCANIAFKNLGIDVDEYISYEIDKYAIKVTQHNFPDVIQKGDVHGADFTQYEGVDWLTGGFPCTKFSIAQKNDRETEPYSGLGWELFMHFKRAIDEAKPKFFLAENNKSMAKPIREEISRLLGFEPVLINSSLLSAQNRQRLYWVGKRNEDGTYSKVDVQQPEDRGILLKDVLDSGFDLTSNEKAYCLTKSYNPCAWNTIERSQRNMVAEPVNITADGKAQTLRATCYKDGIRNMVGNNIDRKTCVAEPVAVDLQVVGRKKNADGVYERSWEARTDGKSSNLTSVESRRMVAEPVKLYCVADRSNYIGTLTKGKVYEVANGEITIKDKQYPIKLTDGFYIIRKLTVSECMRLQTIPSWYDFSVISNTQAYKCLGNGWTVDVIKHLIQGAMA